MTNKVAVLVVSLLSLALGISLVIAGAVCSSNGGHCVSTDFSNGGMLGGGVATIAYTLLYIVHYVSNKNLS